MQEAFVIGSNYSQTVTAGGGLLFLVNDPDYLNNSGAFSATVSYMPPGGDDDDDDDDDNAWEE